MCDQAGETLGVLALQPRLGGSPTHFRMSSAVNFPKPRIEYINIPPNSSTHPVLDLISVFSVSSTRRRFIYRIAAMGGFR